MIQDFFRWLFRRWSKWEFHDYFDVEVCGDEHKVAVYKSTSNDGLERFKRIRII